MTAVVDGPAWAREGLGTRAGRYPLAVEGPVLRAVDRLVPGVSTVTRFVGYHSMYAAIAAHAGEHDLDAAACRRLVRRCEVLMAALRHPGEGEGTSPPHGVDGVRRFLTPDLELARAVDEEHPERSYSPRGWGFWGQYGGPATVLGTVTVREGALRPGRHECPPAVRETLAPLLSLAEREVVKEEELAGTGVPAPDSPGPAEREWLTSVLTASRGGAVHVPTEWEASDRTRRATLRTLARAVDLHGHRGEDYRETLCSAVVFGEDLASDPILAGLPEAESWRGTLLRHYSVGAWRRLWAALVSRVDAGESGAGRTAGELRDWLADRAPTGTLRGLLEDLPPLDAAHGRLAPAERELLAGGAKDPMTNVRLLIVGALRSRPGHLSERGRAVFLGRQRHRAEFLDPTWVDGLLVDHIDRPAADFAARLVDDMLAQSRRVALAKLRIDPATGGLTIFSRLHVRDERYFRTGDEGDSEIGIRIHQLGSMAEQLGLFVSEGDHLGVTPAGRPVLGVPR
ncbi:hypothetical protein [Streptomyces calidiresistens]